MLIKNLKISFVRQEGEKIVFETEDGAELIFDNSLLENFDNKEKNLYFSLSDHPESAVEDQKKLLNELLEEDAD